MSISQTVTVPANHRLVIDVPHEIPEGPVILTFTPATGQRSDAPLPGRTARTVEEALQIAAEKAADPNRKPISRHFGTLSPEAFGDPVAYQRSLRDEWD